MKLLLANLFVASVIALSIVGFAKADGVDTPGFYDDFNEYTPHDKYEFFAPPDYKHKKLVHPEYDCYEKEVADQIKNVPEPEQLLMLVSGIALFTAWRTLK